MSMTSLQECFSSDSGWSRCSRNRSRLMPALQRVAEDHVAREAADQAAVVHKALPNVPVPMENHVADEAADDKLKTAKGRRLDAAAES